MYLAFYTEELTMLIIPRLMQPKALCLIAGYHDLLAQSWPAIAVLGAPLSDSVLAAPLSH